MKNKYYIFLLVTFAFILGLLSIPPTRHVEAQTNEISCPAGFTAIPALIVINPATGRVRQLMCMDLSGNLSLTTTLTNVPIPFSISNASGQSINFTGTDITMSTFGGQNIKFNNPITVPTIAFASLGTVPAAEVGSKYCTDCTTAATCAGAGTGHLAVSNGTNWTCQ